MTRVEVVGEVLQIAGRLPDWSLGVLHYIARRLDRVEQRARPREGISTPPELAANACDVAVERIAELLEHGPGAACSPSGISARGGKRGAS